MLGLNIAYWYATFDHSRFSRSRDMTDTLQNFSGSRDLTTPLSGIICHPRLVLATINLHIKFEDSIFIHYKDTKRDTKFGKWGGLW